MLIVKKFGGTSVETPEKIRDVAVRCAEDYRHGEDVVVVVSAMGSTTDDLIALAHSVQENPSKREMDMLLATGEQISAALLAMALDAQGIRAVSLNAFQTMVHTTNSYGNARVQKIDTERIMHEVEDRRIVIVTGFQGVNRYGDLTTLGRGGSDATAVALAAALNADSCEIYTDVDGIYTADPAICADARLIREISYDEMLDLASLGKTVLHNRAVEMAKKYGVTLVVRSALNRHEGTIVREVTDVERMLISGVALDRSADRISVIGLQDEPGVAFRLFNMFAKAGINIDLIIQAVGHDGLKDITFTVSDHEMEAAMDLLSRNQKRLKYKSVSTDRDVAKLSIVGAGMMSNSGVAARFFEALYNEGININMITTSEIRITVLVADEDGEHAVRAVHDAFQLGKE
ncbi:MAG: aspartate kinase [Lachnospiraceae bacterium]|nr:aspartate kinase [Lachnospiraceae bacterium]